MNQKGFANIILVVVIVATVAVGGYFVFRNSRAPTPPPGIQNSPVTQVTPSDTYQVSPPTSVGGTFSTNINGYLETCMDSSALYKRTNGSWEKVSSELLAKGLYYLDDKFVGYSMCDDVVCSELPNPYTVQLVEYKKIGDKIPPLDSESTANTLPVYKTVPLSGDIKIDIQYFSDKNCQNKKNFSTVIKR